MDMFERFYFFVLGVVLILGAILSLELIPLEFLKNNFLTHGLIPTWLAYFMIFFGIFFMIFAIRGKFIGHLFEPKPKRHSPLD